jgi:hypothetical protein
MKRRLAQIFLVILISLSIPLLSAYLDYYDLAEAGFLACDISFENSDEDNLSIDRQNEYEAFLPSAFSIRFPSGIDLLGQLPHFSFKTCFLDQKTFFLRC